MAADYDRVTHCAENSARIRLEIFRLVPGTSQTFRRVGLAEMSATISPDSLVLSTDPRSLGLDRLEPAGMTLRSRAMR